MLRNKPTSRDSHSVVRSIVPLGLLAICFTFPLQAGTVDLGADTVDFGAEWTLSVRLIGSVNGTETYRVRLGVDNTYYTETGTFISTVAIKISDRVGGMELTSAPEGTTLENWTYIPGQLTGKGCKGKGQGWGCFDFTEYELVFGADIGGFVQWEFEVDIPEGTLLSVFESKADYRNSDGTKNGLYEGLRVPEPSTLILFLSGTGLLAGAVRFGRKY